MDGHEKADVTAVILAGGMSRRLGRNKAVEPFIGETLINRVIGRMRAVADGIIVVVNDVRRIAELDLPRDVLVVADAHANKGSLGGIYTGLKASRTEWAAFCACDMPFVSPQIFQMLVSASGGFDAVVPVADDRPQTMHAIYSRACLDAIRARILADDLKITGFFDDVRAKLIPECRVREIDPALSGFINVNTQADLERALELATTERDE